MRGLVVLLGVARAAIWTPKAPVGGIICDGSSKVQPEHLNDDYCDCIDGADEPLTSACAGLTAGRTVFTCVNAGFESAQILSSHVGDGVCDCCDGSDEQGMCADSCDVVFAAAREKAAREAEEHAAGKVKRTEYVLAHKAKTAKAAVEAEEAKKIVEELEPKLEGLRETVRLAEVSEVAAQKAAMEAGDVEFSRTVESALEGASAWEMSALALELAAACGEVEALMDTAMMTEGGLAATVTDAIDDVEVLSLGLEAADAWTKQAELKSEGDTVSDILTLLGNALSLHLVEAAGARSLATAAARSCRGHTGLADKLRAVPVFGWGEKHERTVRDRALALADIPPGPAPSSVDAPLSPEGDEARAALRFATERHDEAASALKKASSKKKQFPGGPDDGAFEALRDRCFEKRIAKYTYKICPWGAAKQDSVNLGNFAGWNDEYTQWTFRHGQYCPGHGSRELLVDLLCGADEEILDVEETEICKYSATFKTPAAC